MTENFDSGRDAQPDELVADLGADGDQAVGRAGEDRLDRAEHERARPPEVAAEDVPVERVHHDGSARPGEQRGSAPDGAGLGGVRVDDVRLDPPDDPRQPPRGDGIADGRELAGEAGQPDDLDAGAIGDEGHRRLAAPDLPGDERGLVAALREAAGEVRDVECGSSHVEPRDHAQDTGRPGVAGRAHAARD